MNLIKPDTLTGAAVLEVATVIEVVVVVVVVVFVEIPVLSLYKFQYVFF